MESHQHDMNISHAPKHSVREYLPLVYVLSVIIVFVGVIEAYVGYFEWMLSMRLFMGLFFLLFGFFKLLDLKGFAGAYSEYDILAKRIKWYAYLYPFIELLLGILYLFNMYPLFTNYMTLIVMGISSIGVIQAVTSKRRIHCACLGVVVKLPMTTVTIIEDVGMGLMALIMIFWLS